MKTRIEVESGMLTNQKKGWRRGHPEIRPWRYYLFCWKVTTFKNPRLFPRRRRHIEVLTGPTRAAVDRKLRRFMGGKSLLKFR